MKNYYCNECGTTNIELLAYIENGTFEVIQINDYCYCRMCEQDTAVLDYNPFADTK